MQLDDARGLIAALGNLPPELQAAGRRRVAERIAAEGVVDLAAGRVYRFKHGWIPLTHAAALQQAHGNHAKAREAMARHHGAGWDRSARPKARTSERTLATRQPAAGRDKVAKGFVPQGKPAAVEPNTKTAAVRSLPPGDTFKGVHSEIHMGERVTIKRAPGKPGYLQASINGHPVSTPIARTNAHAVEHLDATRGTVEHAKANPANYTDGEGTPAFGMKLGPSPLKRTRAEISTAATGRAQGVAQDRHRRLEAERVGKEERRTLEQQGSVNAAKRARMESQGIRPAGSTGPDETPAAVRRREIVASMSDSQLEAAKARHDNPQTLRFIADEQAKRATAPEVNTRRTEHNQLAGFLANVGGPDTKAAKAHAAAVERDRARNDPATKHARAAAAEQRRAANVDKQRTAAAEWAAGQDDATLTRALERPGVVNGPDHLRDAIQAEIARRHSGTAAVTRQGPGGAAKLADPAAHDRGHLGGNDPAEAAKLLTDAQLRQVAANPNTLEGRAAKAELERRGTATTGDAPKVGGTVGAWKVLRVFPDGSYTAQHATATRHNGSSTSPRLIPVRRTFKPGTKP